MSLNVTLLAVVVLVVWMMVRGFKKGMAKELSVFCTGSADKPWDKTYQRQFHSFRRTGNSERVN